MRAFKLDGSIVLVLGGAVAAMAYASRDHRTTPYDAEIEEVAARFKVPANMLRAIGRNESRFRNVVSDPNYNGTRDYGVFQINERTGAAYGFNTQQLMDVKTNARVAAQLLAELKTTVRTVQARRGADAVPFSNFTWAMAYNVGPDLEPEAAGRRYAERIVHDWQLYEIGRLFA